MKSKLSAALVARISGAPLGVGHMQHVNRLAIAACLLALGAAAATPAKASLITETISFNASGFFQPFLKLEAK